MKKIKKFFAKIGNFIDRKIVVRKYLDELQYE